MWASRFRLASNRYIAFESANIKVRPYQDTISNVLFEETNEQCIFSKIFYNCFKFNLYNAQLKFSPYEKYIIITK